MLPSKLLRDIEAAGYSFKVQDGCIQVWHNDIHRYTGWNREEAEKAAYLMHTGKISFMTEVSE
jgi:hypothetical protein